MSHSIRKIFQALILVLSLCFGATIVHGQVEQVDRVEIPISKDFSIRAVYNFGKDGLIISTKELRSKSRNDPDRVFRHYNTNLEEVGSYELEVPFRQKYSASYEADSAVFILNHDVKFGDFTLLELKAKDLSETNTEGKFPPKTVIHRMFCHANYTVMFGRVGKRKQKIFVLNRSNGDLVTYDLKAESKKHVYRALDYYVNQDGKSSYILFEICKKRTCSKYELYSFDEAGEMTITEVDAGEDFIVGATMTTLNKEEFLITGTYSDRNTGSGKGIFISHYKKGVQSYYKTYPFTGFDRFFEYLSQRQQRKMERIKKRKEARGKSMNYSVRMVLHEVIELNNEYIVVGEAYIPTYRTETRPGPNGTTTSYTVFDGYQYTHATMSTFSKDGEKLNDNTFAMFLYRKPMRVKKFIEVGVDENEIKMVYADDGFIISKSFEDGEVTSSENEEIMDTGNENDKLRGTSAELEYWYDNFFISYGEQFIKNRKDKGVNRKRYVFFLQKLEY